MKIIKPSVEWITPMRGDVVLKRIEECGRICYKSEDKITDTSAEKFVRNLIACGHEAVLEHCSFTLKFICDRGVSHELVRHRVASYCQESTRYCNYSKGKFGGEITVIKPCYLEKDSVAYRIWWMICKDAESAYLELIEEQGLTAQEARAILPNSLKTEIAVTMNLREWRHFFKLRTAAAAHPQMREVANIALAMCREKIPVVFDEIGEDKA